MKRIVTYISSALLLITGLCISCQKEQNFSEENGASVNEVIVKATISGAATKVSFKEDGTNNKLKAAWDNDDRIIGWDAAGNAIELEIASIDNGTAIFKTVEGSSAIPTSGKVYMIYAPGKSKSNISNKSLEYSLADQGSDKLPALMTATGIVSDNVLSLSFTNQLAILAVKNPTFPVTAATPITGLQLSGGNILTKASFSEDGSGGLQMISSVGGTITRACNFTTAADGKTTETMVYFAVLPNSTAADITVSTTAPTGYQISFSDKSFTAGQCYLLNQNTIGMQTFTITVTEGITGGTITTTPTSGSLVAWDTEVTVTANPDAGYELATLTYNDGESHNITDNKFTMPQKDVTVSGSFQLSTFTITPTAVTEGGSYTVQSGSPLVDVTTAKMGDVITVTPSPAAGYSGGTVTVKETASGNNVTVTGNSFNMPASDVTITVNFTHDEYGITGNVTPDGTSGSVTFKKSGSEVTKAYYSDEITVEANPNFGYVVEGITVKAGDENVSFANGKFTMPAKAVNVTVTLKLASFTVSSSKKVLFAPGNLYAKNEGTTQSPSWKWYFYDKQYQFNYLSMPTISPTGGTRSAKDTDNEIDLFCWGYSSNSTKYNDQSKNSPFIDWGTTNLGLPPAPYSGGWRTLSKNDWEHLLTIRTTDSNFDNNTHRTDARYLKCKVEDVTVQDDSKKDVYGLMIFPDTFTWPTEAGDAPIATYINDNDLAWDSVPSYTADQFQALEGAGVVFLPAAGHRVGNSVSDLGSFGHYWISTSSGGYPYYQVFGSSDVSPALISLNSNEGRSVRLVSVVQ